MDGPFWHLLQAVEKFDLRLWTKVHARMSIQPGKMVIYPGKIAI